MSDKGLPMAEQVNEGLEWDYPPPPTPYDLVRDSVIFRITRTAVHLLLHPLVRSYNRLLAINTNAVLNNWPCIVTPNHSSHMDTIAVFASFPIKYVNRMFAVAAKDYFFRNSTVAFAARLVGNIIPLDRTGNELTGLKISLSKLRESRSLLVFPEGTRTVSGELGPFKKGVILLSKEAKCPIIPAYIKGTLQSMPKTTRVPKPAQITLVYGEPLRYWEPPLSAMDSSEAIKYLEQRVKNLGRGLAEGKLK